MAGQTQQLHASAVAIDGDGVLLLGPSGSGKSDLALRLIDGGAVLVADDRVDAVPDSEAIRLSAPASLAGILEVRGIGIVRLDHMPAAPLSLVVDLVARADIERLPERLDTDFMGRNVRHICIDPFEASAPAKIRLALAAGDEAMLKT